MKPLYVAALLPLALAACGEPLDGTDTADLEADAVAAPPNASSTGDNPAEDGMLQTEVDPTVPATPAASPTPELADDAAMQ